MKKIFFPLLSTAFAIIIFITCKKTDQALTERPPVAKAGADVTIILPTDSTTLDGSSSSDPDGNISKYQWTKISGPNSFNIVNASAVKTKVKNLLGGIYRFQLQVIDSNGMSAKDTVQIKVSDPGPIANAGADISISLSSCTDTTGVAELDGTGSSDPNNNIISYCWVLISGPSGFHHFNNPCTAKTRVENISAGEYAFELRVTDAGEMVSRDTMLIHVKGVKEYDFDITLNSTYSFTDNVEDCYYGCTYYDWTVIDGKGNFLPFGEFNVYLNEYADTATLSDVHSTTINIGDANGNHVNGDCSINFKKLIGQGGGPFNGTFTVTDGSAVSCDGNVFTSLAPLTVTGSLDLATHTTTLRIKGKLYF